MRFGRSLGLRTLAFSRSHIPHIVLGVVVLVYVLTFARGLAWQWGGIITASRVAAPPVTAPGARPVAAGRNQVPAAAGQSNPGAPANPANSAPKVALAATNDPAPR